MSLAVALPPAIQPALKLLNLLTASYGPRDFALRFWDGTVSGPSPGQPHRFTLVLNHAGALRRMLSPFRRGYALGEAYIYGDFDVEGDLSAFIGLLKHWVDH